MSQQLKKLEGPMSLKEIKEALVYRALGQRLYQPLRSFFVEMELEWGDTQTAHAERRHGVPVIQLGRGFFAKEVLDVQEAVDIVMHEIMHHLFRHLHFSEHFGNYSLRVRNLAMDAIINAYLHQVGCSAFMQRFYPDKKEFAFLRPNSQEFRIEKRGFWGMTSLAPAREVDLKVGGKFQDFYWNLYRQKVALEQSLVFFQNYFPEETQSGKPLLGGHQQGENPGTLDPEARGEPRNGSTRGDEVVFGSEEAKRILEQLGLKQATKLAKDNFARVIQKITSSCQKPGAIHTGARQTRRMPAKLNRRDMLSVERGQNLFTRGDYHARKITLMFDYSGSVAAYNRFFIELGQSLTRAGLVVKVIIWADRVQEISFAGFLAGEIPDVGGGTSGEAVAQYLRDHKIQQCVIVTDNFAGHITTRVRTQIYLCLVEGADRTGSFSMLPNCTAFDLETGTV